MTCTMCKTVLKLCVLKMSIVQYFKIVTWRNNLTRTNYQKDTQLKTQENHTVYVFKIYKSLSMYHMMFYRWAEGCHETFWCSWTPAQYSCELCIFSTNQQLMKGHLSFFAPSVCKARVFATEQGIYRGSGQAKHAK